MKKSTSSRLIEEKQSSVIAAANERSSDFPVLELFPQQQAYIMDTIKEPIAAVDKQFRLMAFNQASAISFEQVFHVPLSLGMNLIEALKHLPSEQAKAIRLWQRALQGEEFTVIEEFHSSLENQRSYEIAYRPIYDQQQRLIGATQVVRDVTKRVKAEKQLQDHALALETAVAQQTVALQSANAALIQKIQDQEKTVLSLRASETRYRVLVEATRAIVWSCDPQGKITISQPSWGQFTGQSWEAMQGFGWLDMVHPEEQESLLQPWLHAVATLQPLECVARVWSQRDQSHRYVLIRCVPVIDEQQQVKEWIGTCLDIHNLKCAEEEAKLKGEKFHLLAEMMPQFVWTTDAAGKILYVNRRASNHLGIEIPHEEIIQTSTFTVHPDDIEHVRSRWQESVATGKVYESEHRVKLVTGEYHWYLARAIPIRNTEGAIVRWLGTATDVQQLKTSQTQLEAQVTQRTTELVKANAALAEQLEQHKIMEVDLAKSELAYRTLATISPVGIYYADAQGNYTYINRSLVELLGMQHEQITSQTFYELLHPEDRERVRQEQQHFARRRSEDILRTEYRILLPNKTIKWIYSQVIIEKDSAGNMKGQVGTLTDLTQQKQLQKEHVELLKKAEEYQRYRVQEAELYHEKLKNLVDEVCHHILNPAQGMMGSLEQVQAKLAVIETACASTDKSQSVVAAISAKAQSLKTDAKNMLACVNHQTNITHTLLDISNLEMGKIELVNQAFNPKYVIHRAIAANQAILDSKSDIVLITDFPSHLRSCKGDFERLIVVLSHILAYVLAHTVQGKITVLLRYLTATPPYTNLSYTIKFPPLNLTVEEQTSLLSRYKMSNIQSAGVRDEARLNLVMSNMLLERMSSKIEMQLSETETSFSFIIRTEQLRLSQETLFAHPKFQEIVVSPVSSLSTVAAQNKTILIVEDNPIVQKVTEKFLKKQGYQVYIANCGREAIANFAQHKIDLILMDIQMPTMNGYQATQIIRSIEKATGITPIPILGLSGNIRDEHKQKALDVGMNDYLTKPYNRQELLEIIRQLLNLANPAVMSQSSSISKGLNPSN